jgi:allantoin racemase
MIRIWHQSITDVTLQVNYAATLAQQAGDFCGADTVVDIHGVRPGTYPPGRSAGQVIIHPWAHYMLNIQIIENARRAEAEGYDAVAIGCFLDPGLEEARSAVDIPVVSMCESSLANGMAFGGKYALVCLDDSIVPMLHELVRKYGYADRVAAILTVDPPVTGLELEAVYRDSSFLTDRVGKVAEHAAELGADLLIPAEGILNTLFNHHQIAELGGLPILDSFSVLFGQAQMLVNLQRKRGARVSRAGAMARPDAEIIERMRSAASLSLSE